MNKEDIDFLISIQDLEQPDFDNACLERENNRLNKENQRLNNISKELIEDVFTLLRVLNRNVKELDCSNEELKIINKYSYNPKGVDKNE